MIPEDSLPKFDWEKALNSCSIFVLFLCWQVNIFLDLNDNLHWFIESPIYPGAD